MPYLTQYRSPNPYYSRYRRTGYRGRQHYGRLVRVPSTVRRRRTMNNAYNALIWSRLRYRYRNRRRRFHYGAPAA